MDVTIYPLSIVPRVSVNLHMTLQLSGFGSDTTYNTLTSHD